ncbi:MAG: 2-dehydro-3-deoxy-6-phosphogalactonate aldolase [Sphingomonas sp.]|uniref:2-dehydro-3-deoxy-6-phosphogalactonate aldolase n=1 Tax=Sphingomonas sp. TaxID=28214 RepID=UPI003F8208E7
MGNIATFGIALGRCPLIAILRGVRPHEVEAIGETLIDAGFGLIEIPLNSPDSVDSVARLSKALRGRAMVGAGTVLRAADVAAVHAAGGTMIVSPNVDPGVIAATVRLDMVSLPGVVTPSEAIAALNAGATALKLFPAESACPASLKAIATILPAGTCILPVGGITPEVMPRWTTAGAAGFGLGSALYQPGFSADEVAMRARGFLAVLKAHPAGLVPAGNAQA